MSGGRDYRRRLDALFQAANVTGLVAAADDQPIHRQGEALIEFVNGAIPDRKGSVASYIAGLAGLPPRALVSYLRARGDGADPDRAFEHVAREAYGAGWQQEVEHMSDAVAVPFVAAYGPGWLDRLQEILVSR